MKFFVKDFSATVPTRMDIFGMQVGDDLLYRGIENQPSPAYFPLFFSRFLSFHSYNKEILRQRFLHNHAS